MFERREVILKQSAEGLRLTSHIGVFFGTAFPFPPFSPFYWSHLILKSFVTPIVVTFLKK